MKTLIPKYKRIVKGIEWDIAHGYLKVGDVLPSLNQLRADYNVSRDTVITSINELKSRGIVDSVVGKGLYVASEDVEIETSVFLLFDELNEFKQDLYNSIVENLAPNTRVDVFFHHFNPTVFHNLIKNNVVNYTTYVIMPANIIGVENSLCMLPEDKVYILDQKPVSIADFPAVYQNFEEDIYTSLNELRNLLSKYEKIILSFGPKQPKEMLIGFKRFMEEFIMPHEILPNLKDRKIEKGEVYLIMEDSELLSFIKTARSQSLEVGKEVGLISYNDSIFKEVLEGGITCISTDFKFMGEKMAELITSREKRTIVNPKKLIIRKSL